VRGRFASLLFGKRLFSIALHPCAPPLPVSRPILFALLFLPGCHRARLQAMLRTTAG
jgi:hypothetical protein